MKFERIIKRLGGTLASAIYSHVAGHISDSEELESSLDIGALGRDLSLPPPEPITFPVSLRSGSSSKDSLIGVSSLESGESDVDIDSDVAESSPTDVISPSSPTRPPKGETGSPQLTERKYSEDTNSSELSASTCDHAPETLEGTLTLRHPQHIDPFSIPPLAEIPKPSAYLPETMEENLSSPPPIDEPGLPETSLSFSTEAGDPDSFLIDDSDDPVSDEEDEKPISPFRDKPESVADTSAIIGEEIPLANTSPAKPISPFASPSINKAVPPLPLPQSDDEDEEPPAFYLPGLVIPTVFLPIPNTDPLTTLLNKYIFPPEQRPQRDVTGEWQQSDFHTLVMTNSWRALARMARDRVVATDPDQLPLILSLWYLRLACLVRLRLFNQASAECSNLFSALNAVGPPSARTYLFDRLLPFELEVMYARVKYWAGDHMGYLDALNVLLSNCRTKARLAKSDVATQAMWKERGARICLIIASQLVEMKDFTAATKLLEPLSAQGPDISSPALQSAIARIYLQAGHIGQASKHFASVAKNQSAEQSMKDMNAALLACAEGEWAEASDLLTNLVAQDSGNLVAVNNLSVALLGQGKLKDGITALEDALKLSPSSVVIAEPFLFNLATLYELRSTTATEKKKDLLVEVAKWSGDGLKTTCLKLS